MACIERPLAYSLFEREMIMEKLLLGACWAALLMGASTAVLAAPVLQVTAGILQGAKGVDIGGTL